jgi:hypothetical protein
MSLKNKSILTPEHRYKHPFDKLITHRRIQTGWVIVNKKTKKATLVSKDSDGIIIGTTGWGELYYSKRQAEKDCSTIKESYEVRRAQLHIYY